MEALHEFVGSPAGKGQVGVAVDQTGDDEPLSCVQPFCTRVFRGEPALLTDPTDGPLRVPSEGRLGHHMNVPLRAIGSARGELADVVEEFQPFTMGRSMPRPLAVFIARSYPASACRMTPVPGSAVSTR